MTQTFVGRVGILWRGDREAPPEPGRLRPMFDALAAADVRSEPVVFDDGVADEVREQLLQLDGVLVWVDPVMGERDRSVLEVLLRDVSDHGVWVSAHPDVIARMGTKEILARTRELPFGSDVSVYRTFAELRAEFPARVSVGGRVLKRDRGNAGIGVWKVQTAAASPRGEAAVIDVQDAHPRGTDVESVALADFMQRHEAYFAGGGYLVDQPFQPRISDGMIRCYLVRDAVVGFARQQPDASQLATGRVFGLPSGKQLYGAEDAAFASLKASLDESWVGDLQRTLDVEPESLPFLWDIDFLYGPRDAAGDDTYVLCEVNCSSVIPFPDAVPAALARAVADRLTTR